MSTVDTATTADTSADTAEVAAALRRAGIGDVDDSGLARALYSSDGSLYRVLPRAVVRPRDTDEVLAALGRVFAAVVAADSDR